MESNDIPDKPPKGGPNVRPKVRPNVRIELAKPADVTALVDLVNSAYRGDSGRLGWTTEADLLDGQRTDEVLLSKILTASNEAILVAKSTNDPNNDRVCGCVHIAPLPNSRAYLGMLTVDSRQQTAGIGRLLVAQAETFAHQNWQALIMEMTVISQRSELIRWYERRGYRVTGERREFPYGDVRFGIPLRQDLYFEVLEKPITAASLRDI